MDKPLKPKKLGASINKSFFEKGQKNQDFHKKNPVGNPYVK
jgi:hypothetical protein